MRVGQRISAPKEGHSRVLTFLSISGDGTRIVSGSAGHTLRLWDARTGRRIGAPIAGHSSAVRYVLFSKDRSIIFWGSGGD